MQHETRAAERLALGWHAFWAFLCLLTAANYLSCMIEVYPYADVPGLLGFAFKRAYWCACAQVFMAFFGFLWHLYGSREHVKSLERR